MNIRADVTCFHCGHVSAELVGPKGAPVHPGMLRPDTIANLVLPRAGQPFRCLRCG